VSHVVFRQSASGFLAVSLVTSFFLACHGMSEYRGALHLRPFTLVLMIAIAALVTLVVAVHAAVKILETDREAREDEEELAQIDVIARTQPEIVPEWKLPEILKNVWSRPLHWLIRGKGIVRPGMRRVSFISYGYSLAAGTVLTLALIGIALLLEEVPRVDRWLKVETKDWTIVAIVMNVAITAMLQWSAEKRAFGAHYRQYKKMRTTFLVAYNALQPPKPGEGGIEPRKVLERLGKEALAEHADWLLMHRERPLELPKLEL
jgi:hypothetical protein